MGKVANQVAPKTGAVQWTRKFKGYCSDTDKNVLSMADEELSFSDEDTVSCDGRPLEGA